MGFISKGKIGSIRPTRPKRDPNFPNNRIAKLVEHPPHFNQSSAATRAKHSEKAFAHARRSQFHFPNRPILCTPPVIQTESPRRFPWLAVLGFFAVVVAGMWIVVQTAAGYRLLYDIHPWLGYAYSAVASSLAIGMGYLTFRATLGLWKASAKRRRDRERATKRPSQMAADDIRREIDQLLSETRDLATDPKLAESVRSQLAKAAADLAEKMGAGRLEIAAFGTVSSGKSSLLNCLAGREAFMTDVKGGSTLQRNEAELPGDGKITLVDTPGLGEVMDTEHAEIARTCAKNADVVLFVLDGPLKEFEHQLLEPLASLEKQVIVCLNKEDWYAPREQELLMRQIEQQVRPHLPDAHCVAVRSRTTQRKRIRVLASGEEQEEWVEAPPNMEPLAKLLMSVVKKDGRDLLMANMLLRSRVLASDVKNEFQAALDKRAWEVIDTYTWQAGAAAALSPIPVLDVAASAALDVKMVLDLAAVYKQPLDLETARKLVGELGKNLLSTLGMSAAGPALGSAIASLLKSTAPGLGTLTGGLLQGLVQALITRWIGRIFREYFRAGMQEPKEGWLSLAKAKWAEVTEAAELFTFVKTGLRKLGGARRE